MARLDFGTFVFGAIVGAVGAAAVMTYQRPMTLQASSNLPRSRFGPPLFGPPVQVAEDESPVKQAPVKRKVMVPPWMWGRRLQREET